MNNQIDRNIRKSIENEKGEGFKQILARRQQPQLSSYINSQATQQSNQTYNIDTKTASNNRSESQSQINSRISPQNSILLGMEKNAWVIRSSKQQQLDSNFNLINSGGRKTGLGNGSSDSKRESVNQNLINIQKGFLNLDDMIETIDQEASNNHNKHYLENEHSFVSEKELADKFLGNSQGFSQKNPKQQKVQPISNKPKNTNLGNANHNSQSNNNFKQSFGAGGLLSSSSNSSTSQISANNLTLQQKLDQINQTQHLLEMNHIQRVHSSNINYSNPNNNNYDNHPQKFDFNAQNHADDYHLQTNQYNNLLNYHINSQTKYTPDDHQQSVDVFPIGVQERTSNSAFQTSNHTTSHNLNMNNNNNNMLNIDIHDSISNSNQGNSNSNNYMNPNANLDFLAIRLSGIVKNLSSPNKKASSASSTVSQQSSSQINNLNLNNANNINFSQNNNNSSTNNNNNNNNNYSSSINAYTNANFNLPTNNNQQPLQNTHQTNNNQTPLDPKNYTARIYSNHISNNSSQNFQNSNHSSNGNNNINSNLYPSNNNNNLNFHNNNNNNTNTNSNNNFNNNLSSNNNFNNNLNSNNSNNSNQYKQQPTFTGKNNANNNQGTNSGKKMHTARPHTSISNSININSDHKYSSKSNLGLYSASPLQQQQFQYDHHRDSQISNPFYAITEPNPSSVPGGMYSDQANLISRNINSSLSNIMALNNNIQATQNSNQTSEVKKNTNLPNSAVIAQNYGQINHKQSLMGSGGSYSNISNIMSVQENQFGKSENSSSYSIGLKAEKSPKEINNQLVHLSDEDSQFVDQVFYTQGISYSRQTQGASSSISNISQKFANNNYNLNNSKGTASNIPGNGINNNNSNGAAALFNQLNTQLVSHRSMDFNSNLDNNNRSKSTSRFVNRTNLNNNMNAASNRATQGSTGGVSTSYLGYGQYYHNGGTLPFQNRQHLTSREKGSQNSDLGINYLNNMASSSSNNSNNNPNIINNNNSSVFSVSQSLSTNNILDEKIMSLKQQAQLLTKNQHHEYTPSNTGKRPQNSSISINNNNRLGSGTIGPGSTEPNSSYSRVIEKFHTQNSDMVILNRNTNSSMAQRSINSLSNKSSLLSQNSLLDLQEQQQQQQQQQSQNNPQLHISSQPNGMRFSSAVAGVQGQFFQMQNAQSKLNEDSDEGEDGNIYLNERETQENERFIFQMPSDSQDRYNQSSSSNPRGSSQTGSGSNNNHRLRRNPERFYSKSPISKSHFNEEIAFGSNDSKFNQKVTPQINNQKGSKYPKFGNNNSSASSSSLIDNFFQNKSGGQKILKTNLSNSSANNHNPFKEDNNNFFTIQESTSEFNIFEQTVKLDPRDFDEKLNTKQMDLVVPNKYRFLEENQREEFKFVENGPDDNQEQEQEEEPDLKESAYSPQLGIIDEKEANNLSQNSNNSYNYLQNKYQNESHEEENYQFQDLSNNDHNQRIQNQQHVEIKLNSNKPNLNYNKQNLAENLHQINQYTQKNQDPIENKNIAPSQPEGNDNIEWVKRLENIQDNFQDNNEQEEAKHEFSNLLLNQSEFSNDQKMKPDLIPGSNNNISTNISLLGQNVIDTSASQLNQYKISKYPFQPNNQSSISMAKISDPKIIQSDQSTVVGASILSKRDINGSIQDSLGQGGDFSMDLLQTFSSHRHNVNALEINYNQNMLISGSHDYLMKGWDLQPLNDYVVLSKKATSGAAKARAQNQANQNPLPIFPDLTENQFTVRAHRRWVTALATDSENDVLISGGGDCQINVWNPYNISLKSTLKGHKGQINSLNLLDQCILVSGGGDGMAGVFDLQSSQLYTTYEQHQKSVLSVSNLGSEKPFLFASGSLDKLVRVFDTRTDKSIFTLKGHQDAVSGLGTVPGAQFTFYSCGWDNQLILWDLRGKSQLRDNFLMPDQIHSSCLLAYESQGQTFKQLVLGGSSTISLFDFQTEQIITDPKWNHHQQKINSIVSDCQNQLLYTASDDMTINAWNFHS